MSANKKKKRVELWSTLLRNWNHHINEQSFYWKRKLTDKIYPIYIYVRYMVSYKTKRNRQTLHILFYNVLYVISIRYTFFFCCCLFLLQWNWDTSCLLYGFCHLILLYTNIIHIHTLNTISISWVLMVQRWWSETDWAV